MELLGLGRVVRWCWVNFQCRGVLLLWMIVGQGPTVLAVGAGGGRLDIFSLVIFFSLFFLPLSGRRPDIDWNTVSKAVKLKPTNIMEFQNAVWYKQICAIIFESTMYVLRNCKTFLWMDGWLAVYVLFNKILVISERWACDNKRQFVMEPRFWMKRYTRKSGLEPKTTTSVGKCLTF